MELTATKRTTLGKGVQTLRNAGTLPAVVYGAKDETLPIEISAREFSHILKDAGESTIIKLSIDGMEKNVLIHDVDYDPLTNLPRHADFYAVQKGQKVEISIPIFFTGVAPAVKELGANVVKVLHEVEIEADAMSLPHELSVDLSTLATLDSQIMAKDIVLPSGVTLITSAEEIVATVALPEEEPTEPVAAPDMSAIGISEERGKKEEEAPAAE